MNRRAASIAAVITAIAVALGLSAIPAETPERPHICSPSTMAHTEALVIDAEDSRGAVATHAAPAADSASGSEHSSAPEPSADAGRGAGFLRVRK